MVEILTIIRDNALYSMQYDSMIYNCLYLWICKYASNKELYMIKYMVLYFILFQAWFCTTNIHYRLNM